MMRVNKIGLPALFLMAASLTAGCVATTSQLQDVSSGRVGCAPDAIAVSARQVGVNTSSWTATCHGQRYYCSGTDMLRGVSCVAVK